MAVRPLVTAASMAALCFVAAELLARRHGDAMALAPARPLRVWTYATYWAADGVAWLLAPALYWALRHRERAWGARPTARFLAVTVVATGVLAMAACWAGWTVTLGHVPGPVVLRGPAGVALALVVAAKHAAPEHAVLGRVRIKHAPLAALAAVSLVSVAMRDAGYAVLAAAGLLASWAYLRFVWPCDRSEAFAFAALFPDRWAPVVRPVARAVYAAMVRLRVLDPVPAAELPRTAARRIVIHKPAGGADSERRKQLALKSVEDRLSHTTGGGGGVGGGDNSRAGPPPPLPSIRGPPQ